MTEPLRVISLIPSWTETLIEASRQSDNVDVVGRTRFCIHPEDRIADIPVVGGTKDVNWQRVMDCRPDLLLLDREENTREIHDQSPVATHVTHVTSVNDVATELSAMAGVLSAPPLQDMADRWAAVIKRGQQRPDPTLSPENAAALPGVSQWCRLPERPIEQFVYMIWKDPWMAVSPQTFIGSVFDLLGYGQLMWGREDQRYPVLDLNELDPATTLILLSSEPYPFARELANWQDGPFPAALVDGEVFSWFGLRSLAFLEHELTE